MAEGTEQQQSVLDQEFVNIKNEAVISLPDGQQRAEIISEASHAQSELMRQFDPQKAKSAALWLRQKLALALGKPMPIAPAGAAAAAEGVKVDATGNAITGKISEFFEKQKAKIEAVFKAPLKTESLVAILKGIKEIPPEENAARGWTIRVLLDKLREDGHLLVIGKDNVIKILPKEESLRPQSTAFVETFKSYMDAWFIALADIDQALLVSSGSMMKYIETQPDEKRGTLSRDGYRDFLLASHNIPKDATLETIANTRSLNDSERAFLISSYERGENMPLAPLVKDYQKIMTEISAMPGMGNASTKDKQDIADGKLSGKPMTMLVGGIGALFALGYKKGEGFSLWKGIQRAFIMLLVGVVGVGVGVPLAKEWGMDPKELMKEAWKAVKENGGKAADAVADAAKKVAQGDEQSTPATPPPAKVERIDNIPQRTATDHVRNNAGIKWIVEAHLQDRENSGRGTLEHYISFINSPAFQSLKLEQLAYTTDSEFSIFRDTRYFVPEVNRDVNLDPVILKKIIRAYLMSGTYDLSFPQDGQSVGVTERLALEKTAKGNAQSLKGKTVKDLLPVLYPKQ